MTMFADSKVVLGYHGAGLANALFSPAGVVVLEFTTMEDVDSASLWRTNAVLQRIHPSMTWIQHAVDMDHLDNATGDFIGAVSATRIRRHRDQLIKQVQRVRLPPGILFNAMNLLKQELRA